jgi:FAD:protein FMN transferase
MLRLRVRPTAILIASLAATAWPAAERAAAAGTPEPLTLEGSAFGRSLHVEVPAGPGAEKALIAALRAIHDAQAETELASGPLADLNRAAGGGARKVDAKLLGTLARASTFCRWSEGSFGPLGGPLNEVWGLRVPRPSLPTAAGLEQATAAAACDRLSVDVGQGTATLAAGARIDLWSFEAGAALDRAVEVLAAGGVRDASLTLGNVQRAVGGGPDGKGWPLLVAVPPALAMFTGGLTLRDQSFALASRQDGDLRAGGERYAPYLDQHTGRPATGVLATVAISQLALDAQGLAAALFVTGTRRGGMLLGQLKPAPAALWALGDGNGEPLVTDYRWGGRQRRGGR